MNGEISDFKSYLGNPLLKRSGVTINWTPELIDEWEKCSTDPIYFIEKYMKIIHVDRGLIPFKMYGYQKDMVNSMANERYTCIATARQSGKCQNKNTPIRLKNKTTGAIVETTIGEFYESQKNKPNMS